MRRFTVASILVAVVLVVTALPAASGDVFEGSTEMSGEATCDPSDGTYVIAWTFQYVDGVPASVEIATAATTGAIVEAVSLSPTTVPKGGAASTGTTVAPGSTSGTVGLTVNPVGFNGISLTNEVELDGSCVAAVAPAAAEPVEAEPAFTG